MRNIKTLFLVLTVIFTFQATGFAKGMQDGHDKRKMPYVADTDGTSEHVSQKNDSQDLAENCPKPEPPPKVCPTTHDPETPENPEEPETPGDPVTPTGEAAELLELLQTSDQVGSFNRLFETSIQSSGSPSDEDRGVLFALTGDPAFNQSNFLTVLPRTAALASALRANSTQRTQFNQMFGAGLATSGAISATDRTILFGVAGDPAFVQADFLPVLQRTAGLLSALQSNTEDRNAFNTQFGTNIQATGSPNASDRTALFGVAGDPNYDQAAFLGSLGDGSTTPPPGGSTTFSGEGRDLLAAMQANDQTAGFNSLFGTNLNATGITGTAGDVQFLADLTGDPAFNQASFLTVLPVTSGFLAELRRSQAQRDRFNSVFGTSVSTSALSVTDRTSLFNLTGDPAFEEESFLQALERTNALLTALRNTQSLRTSFNSQFGTSLTAAGTLSSADRGVLFGLTGDPAFDLNAFLDSLDPAAGLAPTLSPSVAPTTPVIL